MKKKGRIAELEREVAELNSENAMLRNRIRALEAQQSYPYHYWRRSPFEPYVWTGPGGNPVWQNPDATGTLTPRDDVKITC